MHDFFRTLQYAERLVIGKTLGQWLLVFLFSLGILCSSIREISGL